MSDRIRAALQQLTELEGHTLVDCTADWAEAMIEARAALAEPVGEGPTDEELKSLAGEHSWDDPNDWIDYLAYARAVLARYGHQPAPPAAGEVGELVEYLRNEADYQGISVKRPSTAEKLTRAADLLERQAAPVLEPALARVSDILNDSGRVLQTDEREALELARQALEQRQAALAPVPVSERLPDTSDPAECRMPDGVCWWFDPHADADGAWVLDTYQSRYTHWLPFHALPLPQGEVQP